MMLIDAFLPEGITRFAVDSIFMMPQLGVLSTISEKAAAEVFEKDCLIHLGTCIAPKGKYKEGKTALSAKIELPNGEIFEENIPFGEMVKLNLGVDEKAKATLKPMSGLDLGMGKNNEIETMISGGVVGIVIDTRGRVPYFDEKLNKETMTAHIPEDNAARVKSLKKWMMALEVYPENWLS